MGRVQIALEAVDSVSGVIDQIKGSVSGLSGVATTLGQNMGAVGNIIGDLGGPFKGVGDVISGFAAGGPAGAGIAMIGQAVDFLKDSVKAAGDSERVMASLKTAVEGQGTVWGTVKDAVEGTLKSMQSTSRFSDEELAEALKTLVTHGMDTKDAMVALQTAMDTAVGSGKPLSEIATAIGKAYEGQDTALTRLVPAIGDMAKNMGEGATDADKFQGALKILGDRYGGQALSDAQTYAGVQERMGHAWQDFEENVGKALLPALTDLMNGLMDIGTKAVGPLMDSLGELWKALFGEDVNLKDFEQVLEFMVIAPLKATTSFIRDDVIPAVKSIHEAFQTASDVIGPPLKAMADAIGGFLKTLHDSFQGFYDWLVGASLWTDMWNQMSTIAAQLIGQLISDLGSKLFDPMTKAFTDTVQGVKDLWDKGWQNLKTVGETAWPLISGGMKVWEDLFKGDFKGALDQIQTNWDTAWNTVQTTAQPIWDTIKTNAGTWIDDVKTKVTTATDALKTAWDTNWGAIQTTFKTITSQVQTDLNTRLDTMIADLRESTDKYGPTMTSALDIMQRAMNAGFALVKGDWQGALDSIKAALSSFGDAAKGVMDGIMGALKGSVDLGIGAIEGVWNAFMIFMSGAIAGLNTALAGAQTSVQTAISSMETAASSGAGSIQTTLSGAWNAITTGAQGLWNTLVGHSIWTDMLDEMQSQTASALGNIVGNFQNMSLAVPATIPYSLATSSSPAAAAAPMASAAPSVATPLSITIPITVTLDGQVITKTVKKYLIEDRRYRDRSVGGY